MIHYFFAIRKLGSHINALLIYAANLVNNSTKILTQFLSYLKIKYRVLRLHVIEMALLVFVASVDFSQWSLSIFGHPKANLKVGILGMAILFE